MEHERAIQNLAVESYLLGEMSPSERESFEEHYFECAVCAEDLRAAAQFMEDAKDILSADRALAGSARPATREVAAERSRWAWLSWLQPQAAAAMIAALVVIVGVETLSTIPGLRRQVDEAASPKIVKSIVLRPVTRGDASQVRVDADQPLILVFDPPESPELSPGSAVRYTVLSSDNRTMFEVTGVAPDAGERVTLSIPRLNLPAGDYTLVLKGGAGSPSAAKELGKYPFNVEP